MPHQDRYQELSRELDADRFIKIAKEKTGLTDLGGNQFDEPLRKLLDCAAREVDFHASGLEAFKSDVLRCLVNRLRMQQDIKDHPEILDEDVSDPIIIIGMGRSGTTKLHKVLSAPDSVQKTLFWRMWNPSRFPNTVPGKPDPRIAAAGSSHLVTQDNAVADAGHHMEEQEVEEESILYMGTFEGWTWTQLAPAPRFFDWIMSRPSIESFRYVKTILQYLQWQDGGKRGRPWILKSPAYVTYLDSLLECYPNATIVHAHRDPRETIPSYAKLLGAIWSIQSNPLDSHFVGSETQRMWKFKIDRCLEARDRLRLNGRILDVKYQQVRNDPMSVVREIYRRAGRTLSAEAEQKMAAWHATNEQGRFGKHEYSLEEFGLSEVGIDKAFAEYIRRFIDR
jgi:Sulfotransferase family